MKQAIAAIALVAFVSLATVGPAQASLSTFVSFTGHVAVSTDGFGSSTNAGDIQAFVPAGSTVLNAYLYSAYYFTTSITGTTTLNGTNVNFTQNFTNSNGFLGAERADVTSIVKPVIDAGAGGTYSFRVVEGDLSDHQSGEALVVVYSNPAKPDASVGILDGFSATTGDSSAINFSDPLHPADPGFFAEMRIGDNHSCCTQSSRITVNGTIITQNAGNNDDSADAAASDSNLITVGGDDDPFSPALPTYAEDHERYNLVPNIADGDSTIHVTTLNPTNDDNIFLEAFYVSGTAGFNEPPPNEPPPASVPEPSSFFLLGGALVAVAAKFRGRFA